ncbi:MAG: hypothetical protein IT374_21995 [Polyangiaceae bacterium]|nr:hypothetical protein [Polyangiaceae bacterium]
MRLLRSLPLVGSFVAAVSVPIVTVAPSVTAQGSKPGTMDVSEIKIGMKGYGLTVMKGTEPEKFDVEVVGVLTKFRPGQDLVLIKTPHERLNIAHTVAGMSGSPIFLDGKMIGAYAYGWQFGSEPIAGVTPIKNMLEDMARPVPPALLKPIPEPPRKAGRVAGRGRARHASSDFGQPFDGAPMDWTADKHAAQLGLRTADARRAPVGTGLAPASTMVSLAGFGERTSRALGELLSPLGLEVQQGAGGGGKSDPGAPSQFVDGGAIAVQMIRGDMAAQGIGTVTRVEGDKLVAFGHPMMAGGVSSLPTAIAKVHWILASQARSFKIGEPVRPLGTMVNDLHAAIVIDTKVDAPVFPVNVEVDGVPGAPKSKWSMEVSHDRFMAPIYVGVAMGNVVETTISERRDATWRAKTRIKFKNYGEVEVDDFGLSIGGTPGAGEFVRGRASRAIGMVLNNPWEWGQVEKVDMKISFTFGRDLYSLKGARALEDAVDAGQKARVEVKLTQFNGPDELRTIEVPIAPELAGREVDIMLLPGWMDSPDVPVPESVATLVANLPKLSFSPDVLIASYRLPESGASMKGNLAQRLPTSLLDTLKTGGGDAPDTFPSMARYPTPVGKFIEGRASVRVHVRPAVKLSQPT